ncbi:MAG: ribonuclease III [Pseudomonadota bacterium]
MKDTTEIEPCNLEEFQQGLGYTFKNISLLCEALTHKSFANEMQQENSFGNERLEFLGDAVLELVISHILMERFKDCAEGKLSNMRAAIVNEEELSSLALGFDMGRYLFLSKGEDESLGRTKRSILANVYEAIIAAVYYDGGYAAAFKLIESHFSDLIDEIGPKGFYRDYKSRLQEYSQKTYNAVPRYVIITEEGPDHIKLFESQVTINALCYETGRGSNKKAAEQEAAEKTLKKLLGEDT